jgi:hypothetical protein
MNCCQPSGIQDNATENLAKLISLTKYLIFIMLGFSMIELLFSFLSALGILFLCLMLYMSKYLKNFIMTALCAAIFLIQFIIRFSESGTILAQLDNPTSSEMFYTFLFVMKLPLYLVVIYYSFLLYKELKSVHFKSYSNQDVPMMDVPQRGNYLPFSGTGYRSG